MLTQRVEAYFRDNGLQKRDQGKMYLKTAIIVATACLAYAMLLFFTDSLPAAIFWTVVLAQSHTLFGFSIMHDGGHGAYSDRKWVNAVMVHMLDLVGGNQRLWNYKHNVLHHTYTNVNELDDDLDAGPLLRLSPHQERRPWHRYQAWYALPVYALLSLYWLFISDFREFLTRRIGGYEIPKPSARDHAIFWGGKVFYFSYALVIPLMLHPWPYVLAVFIGHHLIFGLTISIVFQLAHTVEMATFPEPESDTGKMEDEWAIHQLRTTANFARRNSLLSWYVGGLNFQVEHHLFSRVCHVHYPAISEIVRSTCEEFEVPYLEYPSLRAAVRSHLRFLHQMGQPRAA